MQLILLIALALAPGAALIFFIYMRDKFDREPLKLLLLSFALGAASIIPAIITEVLLGKVPVIEDNLFLKTFVGIGLAEEGWKLFFILIIPYRRLAFNEPFDGIVYSMMVSMGFATFENILYVVQGGFGVALMRMFTAVPAHATFAVIMGYFLGLAKFSKGPATGYVLLSLLAATVFHGAYDYCLFERSIPGIWAGAILSLLVGVGLSLRAIHIHRKHSPFSMKRN